MKALPFVKVVGKKIKRGRIRVINASGRKIEKGEACQIKKEKEDSMLDLKQFEGHTPGELIYSSPCEQDYDCVIWSEKRGMEVARLRGWDKLQWLGEDAANKELKANGTLFAAAPKLLDAVKFHRADNELLRDKNLKLLAELEEVRIIIKALSKKCEQLEDDREYNAGLVEKRDAKIESLRAENEKLRAFIKSIYCQEELSPEIQKAINDNLKDLLL